MTAEFRRHWTRKEEQKWRATNEPPRYVVPVVHVDQVEGLEVGANRF